MTVSSEISQSGPYNGNGSATVFPYLFKIIEAEHLRVELIDALSNVTTLSLDVDYTVSGVGNDNGGNITKAVPLAVGQKINLVRAPPFTQQTQLSNQGAYNANSVENRFDLTVMQIQALKEKTDRALTVGPGQPGLEVGNIAEGYSLIRGPDNKIVQGPNADQISSAQSYAEIAETAANIAQSANVGYDEFISNGTAGPYTLAEAPNSSSLIFVSLAGSFAPGSSWSLAGANLNFSESVPAGERIGVWTIRAIAMGTATPGDRTVGDVQMAKPALTGYGSMDWTATLAWGLNNAARTQRASFGNADSPAPLYSAEITYNRSVAVGTDFPGASGGSIPLGHYIAHRQIGGGASNQAFTHSIMAYALNSAVGDNDVIGASGRAAKTNVVGGIGDTVGLWASAYQLSQQNGLVMASESTVYQNAAGNIADDRLNSSTHAASAAVHVGSYSTGSPATAMIAIDGSGFGAWNGMIMDGNTFPGAGTANTVGYNDSSWSVANHYPEIGWKVGSAAYHVRAINDFRVAAPDGLKIYGGALGDARSAGIRLVPAPGEVSYIDFWDNGARATNIVFDGPADVLRIADADPFASGVSVARNGGNIGLGGERATAVLGSDRVRVYGHLAINGNNELRINGNKVLGARRTGWAAATGTAARTTFDTETVDVNLLARRVKALIDDLLAHGLLGN